MTLEERIEERAKEPWVCDEKVTTNENGETKWLVWRYEGDSPDGILVAVFERLEDAERCVKAVNAIGDE